MNSFVELTPKLLSEGGCEYVLSDVFNQDPIEIYFSRQRHRGGSNENPSVQEFFQNAATVIQQKSVYRDLKSMNVIPTESNSEVNFDLPLQKRKKSKYSAA